MLELWIVLPILISGVAIGWLCHYWYQPPPVKLKNSPSDPSDLLVHPNYHSHPIHLRPFRTALKRHRPNFLGNIV
jgi:hypothetical protein